MGQKVGEKVASHAMQHGSIALRLHSALVVYRRGAGRAPGRLHAGGMRSTDSRCPLLKKPRPRL